MIQDVSLSARLVASPAVERLAKLGYAAKGLLYVIAGGTVGVAGLGASGRPVGTRGALNILLSQPFGRLGVALVAIGLAGFVLRRLLQMAVPPEGQPRVAAMRVLRPVGFLFSGLANLGIAITALRLVAGWAGASPADARGTLDLTVLLTERRLGGWVILLGGLALVGFAVFHFYMAATARFQIDLHVERLTERTRRVMKACGRGGYAARGVSFLVAGASLTYIGWQANVEAVRGVRGAARMLEALPIGSWILLTVAIGFIAYGLYLLFVARHLRLIASW